MAASPHDNENLLIQYLQISAAVSAYLENVRMISSPEAPRRVHYELLAIQIKKAQQHAEAVLANTALHASLQENFRQTEGVIHVNTT